MPINLYSKASVDSLLSPKLSISSLTNAAATTLNATAPTTNQVLSYDGTELIWATVGGGGGLTISTLSNAATSTLNATVPTAGQALTYDGTDLVWATVGGGSASWGSITGTLSTQTDLQNELDLKAPLAGPAFTGTATFTGSGGTVSLNDQGLDLSASTAGGLITAGTSGITFSDSTTQQTAYNPDRAQADAIANIIYTQSSGSTGDICFSNVPQFISNLTTNWGIVDNSATYESCTGFSGATYTLSGSVGSGPYKVRVNGVDSSFSI